jgi:ribosomal protein S18 acetylase RimI-like enzyme
MPLVLQRSWIGRRVTLRRALDRSPDGVLRFTGVVGDLLDLDSSRAVIQTRTGVVEVPVAAIDTARLVATSTADELALERVILAGWQPAEVKDLDGWVLRASGGFTGRANSVLPLGRPHRPLEEMIDAARAWYAARRLPLRFQVPREARRLLDAALAERGWTASAPVDVLVARLDFLPAAPGGTDVRIAAHPDEGWLACYRGGAAQTAPARALLVRHERVGFASIRDDGGTTVATGRASVDDDWLGIGAVEVLPEHRRQGLASVVVAALAAWGRERGAVRGHLEVASDNEAGQALYRRLGFWQHHDYHYRSDPNAE